MTSKTLTGKKKEMEADTGDKYQVDVLSNAEVWVPKENEDLDLSTYFSSQVISVRFRLGFYCVLGTQGINKSGVPCKFY